MEVSHRFCHLLQNPTSIKCIRSVVNPLFHPNPFLHFHPIRVQNSTFRCGCPTSTPSKLTAARSPNWLSGFHRKKLELPKIVKAGYPCLHEPARDVSPDDIGSESIQKLIDNMIKVMRRAPGVGLAAPQIGAPLNIIVLEDTEEYINDLPEEEMRDQYRRPFDLLVILNPRLRKKGKNTAIFFEGCLSVDGFVAMVERHLEVEVTGFDRNGNPIKVDASGWQARIFQHECDHLDGILYVDKMVPRTFSAVDNYDLHVASRYLKMGNQ